MSDRIYELESVFRIEKILVTHFKQHSMCDNVTTVTSSSQQQIITILQSKTRI